MLVLLVLLLQTIAHFKYYLYFYVTRLLPVYISNSVLECTVADRCTKYTSKYIQYIEMHTFLSWIHTATCKHEQEEGAS